MSALLRALDAERLKLRGTLAAWTCLIAPATVVTLYVLQVGFSRIPVGRVTTPADAWFMFSMSVLSLWLFLITIPFWTSYLLRVMSRKVILGYNGELNSGLMGLGITDEPSTAVLYNT